MQKPNSTQSTKSSTKLFTFSNDKGETISYIPNFKEESPEKHFTNIQKHIKDKFGIQLKKTNITYNPYNDVNSINATKSIGTNILSTTNVSQFWNLLTSRKHVSCSAMNFKIGDIDGKKATIISVESIQKNTAGKILFLKEDEDDDEFDWDEVFQKQFIPFIKQVTGVSGVSGVSGASGASAADDEEEDDEEDVDYDELPFKIYKIECDNALTISKECNLLNYDEMKEKYDIEDEVDDGGVLEEFFEDDDENDNRYFFIENKACFVIHYKKQVFYWKPDNLKDADDIDWDDEFVAMKKDVCDYFGLINDETLQMVRFEDEEIEIEEDNIQEMWEEAWEDDNTIYLKLLVKGAPLVEFLIDCKRISIPVSTSSISLRMGLNVSNEANQVFSQFMEVFARESGLTGSTLAAEYKLIDNSRKPGTLVDDAKMFLKVCKTCIRSEIIPIEFILEEKVCRYRPVRCFEFCFWLKFPEFSCFLVSFCFLFCFLTVRDKSYNRH